MLNAEETPAEQAPAEAPPAAEVPASDAAAAPDSTPAAEAVPPPEVASPPAPEAAAAAGAEVGENVSQAAAAEEGAQADPAAAADEATGGEPASPGFLAKIKGTVAEKAKQVAEKVENNERIQRGVQAAREKTREVMESERVQKGVEYVKDTSKVVTEKVTEKVSAMREGASTVWGKGRGQILKVREGVGKMAWRGSAKETLAMKEEQWKDMKNLKAEEIVVPARTEHTTVYHVQTGSTLRWTFRVKDYDIGFGVRMRVQEWGGSREEPVLDVERYDSNDTISGSWVADEDRTMVLVFDNRYSKLRSKTIAYIVGTEKPPVFVETPAAGAEPATDAAAVAVPAPEVQSEQAPAAQETEASS
mmetsp:Transcript_10520/g.23905  ORF Transcript_10520/g.23905 Transcript_10520/m.23905 type:complete len:361 (+) Transcript_10520:95-1177(+)|eukprot:CAMPEP_0178422610 /NCGR_PEP_ID=MMETSP0689_2-20121128/27263_1 /TAXON_ID=160604 /ORGANISM="Amphidinium massartii, Strain CS-259" /LENGTH=360 /DNA_ID=CAMNT_0020044181 /DNA_START=95 /DNA_END=1177 /DNA_ORIENTATION=+